MQTLSQIYQVITDAVKLLPTIYNIVQLPIQNILDETFNAKYPLANIEYISSNNNGNEVIRTFSFLSRARVYYKPGSNTPGTQAYLLWGGPAGLVWARNILGK